MTLPTESKARKQTPITTGVLDYFPDALAEVARVSFVGNEQHNPGEPLHWAREKSTDHADCITRHLLERGSLDADGMRHSAKMAWRALALLQVEIEAEGKAESELWIEPLTRMQDPRLACKHAGGPCFHVNAKGWACIENGEHVAPCAWLQPGRILKVSK
jgi:hypothetical protein